MRKKFKRILYGSEWSAPRSISAIGFVYRSFFKNYKCQFSTIIVIIGYARIDKTQSGKMFLENSEKT